ncbi:guanylate kinase [Devosia sp. A449]
MEFQRRGVMLVIASPSGAGKSSISRSLFQQDPNIRLSVSVTTRAKRSDEVEGVHYYFIDVPTFNRMKDEGDLLEWAQVHDNFYGTPRAKVEEQLAEGNDILFDVDYQGTLQLYEKSRADMVTVFILPPTIKELRARLERRAQDSAGTIEKRLRNAKLEMQHFGEYDYIIINDDLEASSQKVRSILAAARLARPRLVQLDSFVKDLQDQIDSL